MRSDLAVSRHDSGGWVVKDPIGLNYALLDDAEYAILRLLDGRTTVSVLMEKLRRKFPTKELSTQDLGNFIRILAGHQLIRQTASGDHRRLHRPRTAHFLAWGMRGIGNVLRLQLPLFNPTALIKVCLPFARFAFSPQAIGLAISLAVVAMAIILLSFGELQNSLPNMSQFLGPQNILTVLAIFVVVKVLHEVGHAFTARYFGAECNECGIMLLVLTPVLYTNVTDAWTLRRRERMLVTAAGIMVELFVASVCTVLWWTATDQLARSVLLNTMLLCSVNTLLFNGNPLLRFDGYFLLADWTGIPNLAARASCVTQAFFLQTLTGVPQPTHESKRHRRFLLFYGLAAMAYRIVLTFAILQLVRYVSRQWQLEVVGNIVSIVLLTSAFIMPLVRFFVKAVSADNATQYRGTSYIRMVVFLTIALLLFTYPFPESVVAPAIVQPDSTPLYATLPGRIIPAAGYGEQVHRDQTVAVLHNPDLELTLQNYVARTDELNMQLQVLQRNVKTANSELIPSLKESLQSAQEQLESFTARLGQLDITAIQAGTLFPPPSVRQTMQPDLPKQWTDTPIQNSNTNAWIERGTLLGFVGNEWELKLLACVTEKEIDGLMINQPVSFCSNSGGAHSLRGHVTEIGRFPVAELPDALCVSGLVACEPSATGHVPVETSYYVVVRLEKATATPAPALYSVGRVRIGVKKTSLLHRLTRFVRQTF